MNYAALKNLIDLPSKWLDGSGPFAEIALSTRIRLARNIDEIPFPHRATHMQSEKVLEHAKKAVSRSSLLNDMQSIAMDRITHIEKDFLLERHLVSMEHAHHDGSFKHLFFNNNQTISIMVNEEDHLRLQVIFSGLQLKEGWNLMNGIDDHLSQNLDYAYSDEFGYLCVCPTNVGTGMRASVLMHLPALTKKKGIKYLVNYVSGRGATLRGYYGEGTKSQACFFQISNGASLGKREDEIIGSVEKTCLDIVAQEEESRKELLKEEGESLKARIMASYNALKKEHLISSREAMNFLSDIRLGLWYGFIPFKLSLLNDLLLLISPAHLQMRYGKKLDAFARDVQRAIFLKGKIREVKSRSSSSKK